MTDDTPKQVILRHTQLKASAEKCDICSLILRSFIDSLGEDGNIRLFRAREALRAKSGGTRLLRLGAELDTFFDGTEFVLHLQGSCCTSLTVI